VTHERLRFDFSHPAALKPAEIKAVEAMVNARIRANDEVETRLLTPDAAMKEGAIAMFGEKYGEEVRVLSIGKEQVGRPEEGKEKPFSMELCGGTHVRRTGDIGIFKVVSESAVAAGIRRIEAVTGEGALAYFGEQERLVREAADALRVPPAELPARAALLAEERKRLEREVADLRRRAAMAGPSAAKGGDDDNTKLIDGIYFNARVIHDIPPKDLKPIADAMKQAQDKNAVVALAAVWEGKVSLVVSVTADLTPRVNAVELVKAGAAAIGGKGGGGRPDMAQAGGNDVEKINDALGAIEPALRQGA
jgi:alanyl-tRNA synthetase